MRRHYGALPAVPKIFHKQNRNDNAKGADSVHVVVSDGGAFELWLGEAKFYKSISDSDFDTFISSVENTLDKVAIRKENSIILGVRDLEECLKSRYSEDIAEGIYGDIRRALAPETSVDGIRRILHIPILLIDECDITKRSTVFDEEYSPNTLIVMYDENVGKEPLVEAVKSLNAEIIYDYNIIPGMAIRIPNGSEIHRWIAYFKSVKGVASVERDRINHLVEPVKPRLEIM